MIDTEAAPQPNWGHVAMPFAALIPAAALLSAAAGTPIYAVALLGGAVVGIAIMEAARRWIDQ